MRLLIAEDDHDLYAQHVRHALPELELVAGADLVQLAAAAGDCPVWLGRCSGYADPSFR